MLRNVGGQAIGSQINNLNTGLPFVGEVKVYITGDGGVQTLGIIDGGVCVAEGNGYYSYTPSQGETNYRLIAFTFIGPNAIPTTVQVVTVTEAQSAAMATATVTTIIGNGPTRTELLNHLAHRLNKTPPPNMDSATETRLASYLNQRHRRHPVDAGTGAPARCDGVVHVGGSDVANYGLPDISKLSRVFETTNERVLWEMSLQDYRLMQPLPLNGTPEAYIWRGRQAVARQPSAATSLFVVSSLTDTTVVDIEGARADGFLHKATVTLQGTTPVNIAPLVTNWQRVDKFFLTVPCAGVVSLVEGGVPLASIPAGALTTVYAGLTLYPTPSVRSHLLRRRHAGGHRHGEGQRSGAHSGGLHRPARPRRARG